MVPTYQRANLFLITELSPILLLLYTVAVTNKTTSRGHNILEGPAATADAITLKLSAIIYNRIYYIY